MIKVRKVCIWHILLGIVLPWLSPACNIGGVFLFFAYEFLQYHHLSRRGDKDDSFKDIYEALVPYVISSIVQRIVMV